MDNGGDGNWETKVWPGDGYDQTAPARGEMAPASGTDDGPEQPAGSNYEKQKAYKKVWLQEDVGRRMIHFHEIQICMERNLKRGMDIFAIRHTGGILSEDITDNRLNRYDGANTSFQIGLARAFAA